jgi:hypothetical protein
MKLNKKAQEESQHAAVVVIMIIVILSLFIIGGFVFKYLMLFQKEGDIEACRLDVIKAFGTKILGVGTPLTTLNNCKRGEVKVFKDESVDEINAYIAKQIDDCLYRINYGNLNWMSVPFAPTSSTACLICSQFKFEEPAKTNYQKGLINGKTFFNSIKNYKMRNGQNLHDFMVEINNKGINEGGNFVFALEGGKNVVSDLSQTYLIQAINKDKSLLFRALDFILPKDLEITSSQWYGAIYLGTMDYGLPACDILMN